MSPAELVDEVLGAGADVVIDRGQARLTGRVPSGVVDAIRADKEAFLEAWKDELASRFRRVPLKDPPLMKTPPGWKPAVYLMVSRYLCRQGDACVVWLFERGNEYVAAGLEISVAAMCASRDLLYWQMRRHERPEEILQAFEEVAKGVKR